MEVDFPKLQFISDSRPLIVKCLPCGGTKAWRLIIRWHLIFIVKDLH